MTRPSTNLELLDVIAEWLHERARERVTWWPAWEDLEPSDTFEAGLIRLAYDRARDFVAMTSESKKDPAAPTAPPTRTAPH